MIIVLIIYLIPTLFLYGICFARTRYTLKDEPYIKRFAISVLIGIIWPIIFITDFKDTIDVLKETGFRLF